MAESLKKLLHLRLEQVFSAGNGTLLEVEPEVSVAPFHKAVPTPMAQPPAVPAVPDLASAVSDPAPAVPDLPVPVPEEVPDHQITASHI